MYNSKDNKKSRYSMVLAGMLTVASTAAFCGSAVAVQITVNGDTAVLNGDIRSNIVKQIQRLNRRHPNVTTLVLANMPGSSDDEANLRACKLIHDLGYTTKVTSTSEIASGAVDMFLAGNHRIVELGAKVGVHSWATGDGTEGGDLPQDDPQHDSYLNYYDYIGISEDFYWFTLQAAPANSIHWMTESEMRSYNVGLEYIDNGQ